MIFLLIFIGLPGLGWYLFTRIYDVLTRHKKINSNPTKDTYITHVHNHYDHRQVHIHKPNQATEVLEH